MEEKLRRKLTRREFLKVSGAGVAGASLLAVCGGTSILPDLPDGTPSADRDANVVLIIMDSLRKLKSEDFKGLSVLTSEARKGVAR